MRPRSHTVVLLLALLFTGGLLATLAGTATAPVRVSGDPDAWALSGSAAPPGLYVVSAGDARELRRAPRLSGAVITRLAVGTRLHIRGRHVSWLAVTTPGGIGGYLLDRRVAHVPQAPLRAAIMPAALWARGARSYPHLADYNGLRFTWQVPFFTPNGLLIARRDAPLSPLLRAAPHVLPLLYERTLQVDLCCAKQLYGLRTVDVPSVWWLTMAGSRLARPIDARQRWIPVADPRPFARCQDVLVDGESMHVWGVRGHLLHVWRGYYSRAVPHPAGARIAPHYSYRRDLSNCMVLGRVTSVRPWSLNLSSRCPRWHGMTWADFLARRMAVLVRRGGWGGIFYDNLDDLPRSALVDVNNDGRADGGILDGVNVWRQGEQGLLAETRRLLPHVPLVVNGDLVLDGLADGREMEGFPLIPGAAMSAAIDSYLYDSAVAPLTVVNADSNAHHRPSPLWAKVDVSIASLGNGYAAYDYGWYDHGYAWWFDAYDGGAGSATTRAVGARATLLPVVHPRRFQRGDVVLLDEEAARVLRVLARGLVVERGVWHTRPAWHPARTTVTTPAQRAAGRGYLGRPVGVAQLVPTADWTRFALPLWLRAEPVSRPAPTAARQNRPATTAARQDKHGGLAVLTAPALRLCAFSLPAAPGACRRVLPSLVGTAAVPSFAGTAAVPSLAGTAAKRSPAPGPVPNPVPAPQPLAPAAVLHLFSTGQYDPGAVRLALLAPSTAPSALRTLVFSARGPAGEALWLYAGHAAVRLVLRGDWHRYVVPVGPGTRLTLGAGRVRGDVWIRGLRLIAVQAFVLRRDFTRGVVIVNPTDIVQHLPLGRAYRILAGDQDPWSDNGRLTCAVSIARYRAVILLDAASRLRCTRAPAPPVASYVVTIVPGVNLRRGPRLAAPIIEHLALGTRLRVRGYHTSWIAVTAPDGASGYVFRGYVRPWAAPTPTAPLRLTATPMPPGRPQLTPTPSPTSLPRPTVTPTPAASLRPTSTLTPAPGYRTSTPTPAARARPAATPTPAAPSQPATAAYVVTAVRSLALRAGPGLYAPVIEWLPLHTRLRVRGYHISWMLVTARDGAGGYVLRRLVLPAGAPGTPSRGAPVLPGARPTPRAVPGFGPPYLVVAVGAANLRAAPSLQSPVLGVLPRGTRLALHGVRGGWAHVETPAGRTGWVWRALTRA